MTATSFVTLSIQPKPQPTLFSPPPSSSSTSRIQIRTLFSSPTIRLCSNPHCASPTSSTPPLQLPTRPQIELEFIGPKTGEDGTYLVQRATAISGEKLLRNIMLDNKIELYAAYGKVMNCGGGGSCGTCIVEIVDGKDLLNERTDTERRYLGKKPESWRLACQTIVGNKENTGKVVVQRMPQWKK